MSNDGLFTAKESAIKPPPMKPIMGALHAPETPKNSLSDDDLGALDGMSREELISLIKGVSGPMWGIGLKTKEEIADAMLFKLAHTALTSKDAKDMMAAIREWLDRVNGKAVQPIVGAMKVSYEPLVIRGMLE